MAKLCGLLVCYTIQPCINNYQHFREIPSIIYHGDGGNRFLCNAANTNKTIDYHNPKDNTLNKLMHLICCYVSVKHNQCLTVHHLHFPTSESAKFHHQVI